MVVLPGAWVLVLGLAQQLQLHSALAEHGHVTVGAVHVTVPQLTGSGQGVYTGQEDVVHIVVVVIGHVV